MTDLGKKYMDWWGDALHKMPYDIKKGLWHWKNLRATLWIILANPAIVLLYITGIFVFAFLFFCSPK